MGPKRFYITTTIPYVNAPPHLGFAVELIQADVVARYQRLAGSEVVFNTGTDEHGEKIYRKAVEENETPQAYVDRWAKEFIRLKDALTISYTNFIRTTDPRHVQAAQEFWKRCTLNGDIEKKFYKIRYCIGCELEKTDSELVQGECPLHPNLQLEEIEEENYFFKWSRYQRPLLEFYQANPHFVFPESRFNEIKKFVAEGLHDFSASRLKKKMPWGVPVPGDEDHVMYVWFDAFVNYISTLGWPNNKENFEQFWPGYQIAGKDQVRQQAAMWQAMLMSVKLQNSKGIWIHGFVNVEGQKMSKSLGNVIDPFQIVARYGTDALRFWCIREVNPHDDTDFSWDKFKESYNANLANGLGNLVSRVLKMAGSAGVLAKSLEPVEFSQEYMKALDRFEVQKAADYVWGRIQKADIYVQKTEPFRMIKTDKEKAEKDIQYLLDELALIARLLEPLLPTTSKKIIGALKKGKSLSSPLFPRVS